MGNTSAVTYGTGYTNIYPRVRCACTAEMNNEVRFKVLRRVYHEGHSPMSDITYVSILVATHEVLSE